jgi:hypothetical protein
MVDVLLLALWTVLSPIVVDEIMTPVDGVGIVSRQICTTQSQVFAIILSLYKVLLCGVCCYWSFATRNTNAAFAESKHIMFA